MKPAERKKLKEILKRKRKREAEEFYIFMFHILVPIDREIKRLIKDGYSQKEANEIVRKRIFGS